MENPPPAPLQVVRTDLLELMNMDIGDAPVAYTPFCDNNKEMDQFRFWKGGFWLEHLQVGRSKATEVEEHLYD